MIVAPTTAPARAAAPPASEKTTTIVIGSGFSALAVAAELNRQGIEAIVMDGSCPSKQPSASHPATGGISLDELSERSEIVRLLEHYARRHALDIRPDTKALELVHTPSPVPSSQPWRIHTATGTLSAHSVIFTRGALSQLRKVLHGLGITSAADLRTSMQALGLYLVGVGDLAIPTTHEILHQAKRAGQSIAARLPAVDSGLAAAIA